MEKHGFSIFCDDIRHEVGGKRTLVGIYQSEMLVNTKLPTTLPKLGVVVRLQLPVDEPPARIDLMIYLPHDEADPSLKGAFEFNLEDSAKMIDVLSETRVLTFISEVMIAPVEIKSPGLFKVRAIVDGEMLRLGALRVREQPVHSSDGAGPSPAS